MTLLLREVVRFVVGASLWVAVLAMVAGLSSAAIISVSKRDVTGRDLGLAVIGGGVTASAAHSAGASIWAPELAGRPLPVIWAAVGAVIVTLALRWHRARSDV